jgi:large subunit ribosomal protein L22
MKIKATLKYLRMAPRKVRRVSDLIKGLPVSEAENQLKFLAKRPAVPILKLLQSAVANAARNFNLDKDDLYVFRITVDRGPTLKRWLPRAMGRAAPIQKKTSHVALILEEKPGIKKETGRKKPKVMPEAKKTADKITEESKSEIAGEEAKQPAKTFKAAPKKEKPGLAKRAVSFGQKIFRRKSI